MLKKKALGATAAILLTATSLVACGNDAQNGTFPNYGKDEAYDLTDPEDFSDFVVEYETLPDDYIEEIALEIDDELGVAAEPDAIKEAGDVFCESSDLKSGLLTSAGMLSDPDSNSLDDLNSALGELNEDTAEEELQAIDETLGTGVDLAEASDEEALALIAYSLLGGVSQCQQDFSSDELAGTASMLNIARGESDLNPSMGESWDESSYDDSSSEDFSDTFLYG